jgi:hypothetical protein
MPVTCKKRKSLFCSRNNQWTEPLLRSHLFQSNSSLKIRKLVHSKSGLPDFSWCNIPKRGKSIPNNLKMYPMATKYTIHIATQYVDQMDIKYTNIFHCKALQNLPKSRIFGLKNMPSGSTAFNVLLTWFARTFFSLLRTSPKVHWRQYRK